jgi:hypothetical protein
MYRTFNTHEMRFIQKELKRRDHLGDLYKLLISRVTKEAHFTYILELYVVI